MWNLFRKYHYLNTDIHPAATQYVGILNGKVLVCHTGVIQAAMKKGVKRVHRLVTLPDYQGIGLGSSFIDFIAGLYKAKGLTFNLITTTPAIRFSLIKSDKWYLRRSGHVQKPGNLKSLKDKQYNMGHIIKSFSCDRVTYSFDYIGSELISKEITTVEVKKESVRKMATELNLF